MKVAITGAQGQLGSELLRQLGPEAVGLDLPEFDLTDRTRLLDTLQSLRPGAVINTAAYTQVDKAEDDVAVCRAVNATGVAHLAEACRRLDCPLVQISTDYVFGRDLTRSTPYRETDAPGPLGVYGQTKLEGEQHAAAWPKHYIVRTCGLYGQLGPRTPGNFVTTMLRLGRERDHLRIVNDQHCTPSYVPHVARAIRFLLGTGQYGLYHLVNTGQTTWYALAAELFRLAGLPVHLEPITTAQYGARAPRPTYSVLDIAKYHTLPGCPIMPPWKDALVEFVGGVERRGVRV